jgi:hypothetical protein
MRRLCLIVSYSALALCVRASDANAGWRALETAEKGNRYTIVLRDGTCQNGKLQKVEPKKITLESGNTVMRSDVIYIGENISPHDILYSGRSSWYDVKEVKPGRSESLDIRLKSGKSMRGSVMHASDSDLTVKRFGRAVTIAKKDIAQINYVRFKPVSESHRYLAQEAPELEFLDPKWWQYLLRIDALQSIRIYDSTIPEDNSPLSCKGDARK